MPLWVDQFISWLYTRRLYGPRCPDFEPTCHCCKAWKWHDEVFDLVKRRRRPSDTPGAGSA